MALEIALADGELFESSILGLSVSKFFIKPKQVNHPIHMYQRAPCCPINLGHNDLF